MCGEKPKIAAAGLSASASAKIGDSDEPAAAIIVVGGASLLAPGSTAAGAPLLSRCSSPPVATLATTSYPLLSHTLPLFRRRRHHQNSLCPLLLLESTSLPSILSLLVYRQPSPPIHPFFPLFYLLVWYLTNCAASLIGRVVVVVVVMTIIICWPWRGPCRDPPRRRRATRG